MINKIQYLISQEAYCVFYNESDCWQRYLIDTTSPYLSIYSILGQSASYHGVHGKLNNAVPIESFSANATNIYRYIDGCQ